MPHIVLLLGLILLACITDLHAEGFCVEYIGLEPVESAEPMDEAGVGETQAAMAETLLFDLAAGRRRCVWHVSLCVPLTGGSAGSMKPLRYLNEQGEILQSGNLQVGAKLTIDNVKSVKGDEGDYYTCDITYTFSPPPRYPHLDVGESVVASFDSVIKSRNGRSTTSAKKSCLVKVARPTVLGGSISDRYACLVRLSVNK